MNNNHSKIILMFIIAAILLLTSGCIKNNDLYTFSVSNYQEVIKQHPFNREVGRINGSAQAAEAAEVLFSEVFTFETTDYKPYVVQYDSQSDTWLVFGSLPSEREGTVTFGKTPCVIIHSSGKVLALWFG